jgi:hypothetical protein
MPDLSHTIAFRAVMGAVRNTLDAHPDWNVPQGFARSVAKRAAGTLAEFKDRSVLDAARRSGKRKSRGTPTASAMRGCGPASEEGVARQRRPLSGEGE